MGIDLAPYGTAESSIGIRRGDNLVDLKAFPSQRVDHFINGDPESKELSPVRRMVRDYGPYVIVYDADGVGAGAIGEFTRLHEWAIKHRFMDPNSMIIPFRGGKRIDDHYTNSRSAWWWALRRRFERHRICLQISDPKTESQLSQLTYRHTNTGQIRVETKDEMRNRSLESPDRADAVMYTFAFSEELPDPDLTPATQFVVASGYVHDDTEAGMWSALDKRLTRPRDDESRHGHPRRIGLTMATREHGLFRLLDHPAPDAAKGGCYVTYGTGPCVDTGVLIEFEGTLTLSTGTIKELAEVAGLHGRRRGVRTGEALC
jgi:hypothetical protein